MSNRNSSGPRQITAKQMPGVTLQTWCTMQGRFPQQTVLNVELTRKAAEKWMQHNPHVRCSISSVHLMYAENRWWRVNATPLQYQMPDHIHRAWHIKQKEIAAQKKEATKVEEVMPIPKSLAPDDLFGEGAEDPYYGFWDRISILFTGRAR